MEYIVYKEVESTFYLNDNETTVLLAHCAFEYIDGECGEDIFDIRRTEYYYAGNLCYDYTWDDLILDNRQDKHTAISMHSLLLDCIAYTIGEDTEFNWVKEK